MADSLRDQLVKAGLATANQAKKAERQAEAEKRTSRQPQGGKAESEAPKTGGKKASNRPVGQSAQAKARTRAAQLNAEKLAKDRALANVRNEKAATKALRAEIKQIILGNDQRSAETKDDDVPYNFLHGKKIKRIHVPKAQVEQLSAGTLAIVNNDGRYHLVSRAVADQLSEKNPKCVIAAHSDKPEESGPDDDHYAKFKVPDDLDW
jgi:uncharacterized protein YaiL (DUF2058 family)